MKGTIFATLLAFIVAATGCTSDQVQAIENDFHKGVAIATNAVVEVDNNSGVVDADLTKAEAALTALGPKAVTLQKALADAQAAWTAYKNKKGSIESVLAALAVLDKLTMPDANQPVVARTARKKG